MPKGKAKKTTQGSQRTTGSRGTRSGADALRKRQSSANAQPTSNPKRPKRMSSSRVHEKENQPRPLTTADIPIIVNAVLGARRNQPTLTRDDLSASGPDRPAAVTPGVPTPAAISTGALTSPSQTPSESEDSPDFGKLCHLLLLMCEYFLR